MHRMTYSSQNWISSLIIRLRVVLRTSIPPGAQNMNINEPREQGQTLSMTPHLGLLNAMQQTSDKLALYSGCCCLSSIRSNDIVSPGRCSYHCMIEINSQITNN